MRSNVQMSIEIPQMELKIPSFDDPTKGESYFVPWWEKRL